MGQGVVVAISAVSSLLLFGDSANKRGQGHTSQFAFLASPNGQAQPAAARIDAFMRRAVANGQFSGAILVVDRGQRIYEQAFGEANREWNTPNTVNTRFEIASMTKPMTAIVIMQLVQEGKLRLDAKVSEYLSYYPAETGQRITVEQLLNHTSGLQQDIAF